VGSDPTLGAQKGAASAAAPSRGEEVP
jgi:hypothetical protein